MSGSLIFMALFYDCLLGARQAQSYFVATRIPRIFVGCEGVDYRQLFASLAQRLCLVPTIHEALPLRYNATYPHSQLPFTKKKPMEIKEKNRYLIYSLLWLSFGSFVLHRDSKIYKENLESIEVTLEETPRFYDGNNPHLTIITEEYLKKFVVAGMSVRAMDKARFTRQIRKGDKVILYIDKKDKAYLKYITIINNSTAVYGFEKNLISYTDLDLRNLKKKKR